MTAEEWLKANAIRCIRHRGRWSRQGCVDMNFTAPELCASCAIRPVDVQPSAAAVSLRERIRQHAFVRYGSKLKDATPQCDFSRIDPYQDVPGTSEVLL